MSINVGYYTVVCPFLDDTGAGQRFTMYVLYYAFNYFDGCICYVFCNTFIL